MQETRPDPFSPSLSGVLRIRLDRQSSFIQDLKFSERPCIVPHEVIRLNVVHSGSLRQNRFLEATGTETALQEAPS